MVGLVSWFVIWFVSCCLVSSRWCCLFDLVAGVVGTELSIAGWQVTVLVGRLCMGYCLFLVYFSWWAYDLVRWCFRFI